MKEHMPCSSGAEEQINICTVLYAIYGSGQINRCLTAICHDVMYKKASRICSEEVNMSVWKVR